METCNAPRNLSKNGCPFVPPKERGTGTYRYPNQFQWYLLLTSRTYRSRDFIAGNQASHVEISPDYKADTGIRWMW